MDAVKDYLNNHVPSGPKDESLGNSIIYANATTEVKTPAGSTPGILMNPGVKQGHPYPLSYSTFA